MNRRLALFVSVLVLLPSLLQAFYASVEMKAETLRKDPSIQVRAQESGDQVTFRLAIRKPEHSEVYLLGSLRLVNPEGVEVAQCELRGEDIHRALAEEVLRQGGWQEFKCAEVFRFTVRSNLLAGSRFSWEQGPRSDAHGRPYGGGVIFSSSLQELLAAAEKAHPHAAAK